jgi:hypothetical protein
MDLQTGIRLGLVHSDCLRLMAEDHPRQMNGYTGVAAAAYNSDRFALCDPVP